jgi:DNA-directed RNA polymerase
MSRKRKRAYVRLEIEALNDPRFSIEPWSIERIMGIGSWALWAVSIRLPWFQVHSIRGSEDQYASRYLMLSEEGKKEREVIELAAARTATLNEPMIIPPSDWTLVENGFNGKQSYMGGYLTETPFHSKRAGRLIHGHLVNTQLQPDSTSLKFLNKLQQQPWKINTFILDILHTLSENNIEIGAFISYNKEKLIIPSVPDEIMELPDDDQRKRDAKTQLWLALDRQRQLKNRYLHPQQAIAVAEDCREMPQFYIPWFFDKRLRAYPLVSKLSPQGTDYQKALLLFADGSEVTLENWYEVEKVMMIAIATTWGNKVDKMSFVDRVSFAREHVRDNIETILSDPLSEESKAIWTKAEEPFQHLALLKEYKEVFLDQTETVCRVPIGYDATCSGLQLLGAFIKDEVTCTLVNVLPRPNGENDPPQDAYGAVAASAREILSDPSRWRAIKGMEELEEHGIPIDKIDRKVAKKVVMLIPYGGSYDTLRGHVKDGTEDWGIDYKQVNWLTKALILGMQEAVPGFSALNAWFKAAAKAAMDQGKEHLFWHTAASLGLNDHDLYYRKPSVRVAQTYLDPLTKQVKTHIVGKPKCRTEPKVKKYDDKVSEQKIYLSNEDRIDHPCVITGYGEVLKRKNETALAANWTHSQDAAVLQLAFQDFDMPFTTVHDCVYAPATAIEAAVRNIRRAFVEVTSWDAIGDFIRTNELDIAPPEMGTADITQALYSDYLFS